MTQWIEGVKDFIFEGEKDEEDYISWKPLKKEVKSNFEDIEKELNVHLHPDIKALYNCYWFLELAGNYNGHDLVLNLVIPGVELEKFKHETVLYKEAHNESGEVKLEDYERNSFEIISGNLSKLIGKL
ncbi:SecY-interacting protein Syd [Priestia megaterium]|nr:SecY-interacting protein Syd [Priestia megaterium]